EEVSFTRSFVRTPKTTVNLNGTVSREASLSVQLQSNDLREVETIVNAFHPMQPVGLSGTASFSGSVRSSTSNPQINGQLQAMDLPVRGATGNPCGRMLKRVLPVCSCRMGNLSRCRRDNLLSISEPDFRIGNLPTQVRWTST